MSWERRLRPPRRLVIASWVIALLFTILSTLLIGALLIDRAYLAGFIVSASLALIIPASIARGATVEIDDGALRYGFGQRPYCQVPLSAITGLRRVDAGLLSGVGLAVPLDQVEILHRKGVGFSRMQDYHRAFGTAVVLEFGDDELLSELQDQIEAATGVRLPSLDAGS